MDTAAADIADPYDDGLDVMHLPIDASDEAVLRGFVQLLHVDKILARSEFPGARALPATSRARILGTDVTGLERVRSALRTELERRTDRLLADGAVRDGIATMPLAAGDTVVAIGDSLTDDELSWFQLLASAHRRVTGSASVRFVNAGIAGETSAEIMRRIPAVARTRPDWCLVMAGTNDALRCGADAEMLVSHEETTRNLAAIDAQLRGVVRRGILWLTPPPILDALIAGSPFHRERGIVLRDEDVAAKSIRVPAPSIDLRASFSNNSAEWLSSDGVHPSPEGHARIAAEVAAAFVAWAKA